MTQDIMVGVREHEGDMALAQTSDDTSSVKSFDVQDIIAVTARLAQILAREADLLDEMKISKIAELQKEKTMLTNTLAEIKKHVLRDPSVLDGMRPEDKEDLENVIMIFNQILEENYSRLNKARLVNAKLVEMIQEVIRDKTRSEHYDRSGVMNTVVEGLSLSLNEKV